MVICDVSAQGFYSNEVGIIGSDPPVMKAGSIHCEPRGGLVAWILGYVVILTLGFAALELWFPNAMRPPQVLLTAGFLFIISPFAVYLVRKWYGNRLISTNKVTLQQIRAAISELESVKVVEEGPQVTFTDEELVSQFPRECREYVRFVIREERIVN